MMPKVFSFHKSERLNGKKNIDTLFQTGKAFFVFPYKIIFIVNKDVKVIEPLQVIVSVPKRQFKLATKRNRIKRLTKEAYRLQRNDLKNILIESQLEMKLMLLYTGKEERPFSDVSESVGIILKKLENQLK